jgi:anaerobic selenocysteine-containing dehydrogenase
MKLRRLVGLDIAREKYAFTQDAAVGHISAQRAADRWVKTTCGYCSVGCGMLLGIREGKVVTSRGDPGHSVNRRKLCPKGLAEH